MNKSKPKYKWFQVFEEKLERPMLILSFVWLCILISEVANYSSHILSVFGTCIWILFIFYFAMRIAAVSKRIEFLKKNWLFILAILVSALRFFPFLQPFPLVRALTATIGIQVIWILASADQGMRFLHRALGSRGASYALALTFVVLFVGSAGMFHFEDSTYNSQSIHSYLKALWWTAMQMTNISSSYSITTTGGRIICLCISIYSAVMFGYLTALLATFLIDRETKEIKPEIASQKSVQEIHEEIIQLRRLVEDVINLSNKH